MSGIDWDKEFSRMNPQTPQAPQTPEKPEKDATPSRLSAAVGGMRRNTAALAVCGTIAVVAVCGTVVAVTSLQSEQAAQERARAQEKAANSLVEAEADKQRAQTEEAASKTLYEREMTIYRECMKARAAAVAKAASYDVARIPACDAPTLGGAAPRAEQSDGGGVGGSITASPWLWVALAGGGGLIAYKKLSSPSGSSSGSGAITPMNDKGFTFEKGA
ncbi:hypothetical protein K388_07431 [Streptomyces sp. KhCrAH-43]|uniref:hypothetical protein n=1 Tax=unclassified Streptomyces TaxID=2593676 RepID=UPI00036E9D3C|nr:MULTISPECIES: hypothetical protein [unclassified Streptomyces]MYS39153.1 hypothetical protein [Streptomyces sp. SID4920]MYX64139.1 hypothetical protein [Streptomyces sp. SID8373]RAJ43490.1 hypothetical protein K388_07431 [Streptomyces sp. KhCrAH-43]